MSLLMRDDKKFDWKIKQNQFVILRGTKIQVFDAFENLHLEKHCEASLACPTYHYALKVHLLRVLLQILLLQNMLKRLNQKDFYFGKTH